jgi:serine/threonine protein phosphatase PrpC/PAS domain-containing protein
MLQPGLHDMKERGFAIILWILAFILAAVVAVLLLWQLMASSQSPSDSETPGPVLQSATPANQQRKENRNGGSSSQETSKRENSTSKPKFRTEPVPGTNPTAEIQQDSSSSFAIQAALYLALSLSFVVILAYGFWHQVRVNSGLKERGEAYKCVRANTEALSRVFQYAIFAENTAGQILIINVRFCELLGLNKDPEILIGAPTKELRRQSGSNAAAVWDAIDSIAQEKNPLQEKQVTLNEHSYGLTFEPILLEHNKIGNLWVLRPKTDAIKNQDLDRPLAKAQLWQEKMATGLWAPKEFHNHLPYSASFEYTDAYSRANEGLTGWSLIGATRRGRTHAHAGTHRDDAFRWAVEKNFTIVCVADGAGSHKYSRIGAETICRYVCEHLSARLKNSSFRKRVEANRLDSEQLKSAVGDQMTEVIWEGCLNLVEIARKVKCDQKDFRCTFLLAVHGAWAGSELILTNQIGDGFIIALGKDGQCEKYGTSDSGDFSGEVSCFVPDRDVENKANEIKCVPASGIEALLLCSDGIEDPFFPIEKKARTIFCQLYDGVKQKLSEFEKQSLHDRVVGEGGDYRLLEEWLGFEKRGENDDRTLVMLYRKPVEISPDILK